MRMSIAALAIGAFLPAMAVAQSGQVQGQDRIPERVLREQNEACMNRCTDSKSVGYCSDMCGCMGAEMARYWTLDEYQQRFSRMSTDQQDSQTNGELQRIASYCAQRNTNGQMGQGGSAGQGGMTGESGMSGQGGATGGAMQDRM
ncbi:MAG: hypothetical protein HXY25_06280 [Alphaproteobacteria bacterium]|nr:hypothetical protein [Alphaproteobacteria bacterium]